MSENKKYTRLTFTQRLQTTQPLRRNGENLQEKESYLFPLLFKHLQYILP